MCLGLCGGQWAMRTMSRVDVCGVQISFARTMTSCNKRARLPIVINGVFRLRIVLQCALVAALAGTVSACCALTMRFARDSFTLHKHVTTTRLSLTPPHIALAMPSSAIWLTLRMSPFSDACWVAPHRCFRLMLRRCDRPRRVDGVCPVPRAQSTHG